MPRSYLLLLTVVLLLSASGLFWQWLAVHGQLDAASIEAAIVQLGVLRESPLAMLATVLVFPVLLQLMFPLTVLVGATGLVFGPVWGLACAMAGTLSGSALGYVAGAAVGREALMRLGGDRVQALSRYLADRGGADDDAGQSAADRPLHPDQYAGRRLPLAIRCVHARLGARRSASCRGWPQ